MLEEIILLNASKFLKKYNNILPIVITLHSKKCDDFWSISLARVISSSIQIKKFWFSKSESMDSVLQARKLWCCYLKANQKVFQLRRDMEEAWQFDHDQNWSAPKA